MRDQAIVAAVHSGEKQGDVAKRYGLTRRQISTIMREFRTRPTAVDQRPMEILERAIRTLEQQMAAFAAMAEDTLDRAPAVAVASLKGFADATERYLRLLASVGKLPSNLELFRQESEIVRLAVQMADELQAVQAGERTIDAAIERFQAWARRPAPDWQVDGDEVRELEEGV